MTQSKNTTKAVNRDPRLVGKVFNRLTIVEIIPHRQGFRGTRWACRCACGGTTEASAVDIKFGSTTSCGCHNGRRTHGMSVKRTSEYRSWECMNQRVNNSNNKKYGRYGGSGITIDPRWIGKEGFANFLADMGSKPTPKHTIDRFPNPKGNYAPFNCRWATYAEQNRNTSQNRMITFNGRTLCLQDWAKELNTTFATIRYRVENWPLERALTEPVKHPQRH